VKGVDYYAAIWEKATGPSLVTHHGMTASAYQEAFDALRGQGYRLISVSGY
jgi:hypothetical protein